MSARRAEALWVLLGIPLIIAGFVVNPGPSSSDTTTQLVAYGLNHQTALTVGGWLQITGTVLTAIFAISVVIFARESGTLRGVLVVLGSTILIAVSLSELTAYKVLATGHFSTARVAVDVISGVQLGYSIVAAPILFCALGYLVLETQILPKVFGYSALGFGLVFWVCGVITVVTSIQGFINLLSGVQALWWLSAGVFIAVRGLRPRRDLTTPVAQLAGSFVPVG
jgi:hypothetical protein